MLDRAIEGLSLGRNVGLDKLNFYERVEVIFGEESEICKNLSKAFSIALYFRTKFYELAKSQNKRCPNRVFVFL